MKVMGYIRMTAVLLTLTTTAAFASTSELYWATVTSDPYVAADPTASIERSGHYSAYLCTVETANRLFAGVTDVGSFTAYASSHYVAALAKLSAEVAVGGVDRLEAVYAVDGQYSFTKYFADALMGDYLLLLAYAGGDKYAVRVFGNEAVNGSVLLDPDVKNGGTAGEWTMAVPEPSSGLLLLLGLALQTLRRRNPRRIKNGRII